MALIVMPSLLSKRPWARIRARCEASFFIVLSKSVRCCSVRGRTYLTLIALKIGVTCHIALELSREILYQKTFGRALTGLLARRARRRQTTSLRHQLRIHTGRAMADRLGAFWHHGLWRHPAQTLLPRRD